MGDSQENRKALFNAILKLRTLEECDRFFTDLCTPGELDAMADRWLVAILLEAKVPYREIYDRTGVSTATVTRVARALLHGEGGYRRVIDRMGLGKGKKSSAERTKNADQ